MKKLICILAGAAILAACEQKTTTVNPPAEKKNREQYDNRESAGGEENGKQHYRHSTCGSKDPKHDNDHYLGPESVMSPSRISDLVT
jgi:hypothetical protein